jgi:hypothetical protein
MIQIQNTQQTIHLPRHESTARQGRTPLPRTPDGRWKSPSAVPKKPK